MPTVLITPSVNLSLPLVPTIRPSTTLIAIGSLLLFISTLLKFCPLVVTDCTAVPANVTVLVPGVNVAPALTMKFPLRDISLFWQFKFPEDNLKLPSTVKLSANTIPPELFIVKLFIAYPFVVNVVPVLPPNVISAVP